MELKQNQMNERGRLMSEEGKCPVTGKTSNPTAGGRILIHGVAVVTEAAT